jgi:hypothetical protein
MLPMLSAARSKPALTAAGSSLAFMAATLP